MTDPRPPRLGGLLFVLSGNMLLDAVEVAVAVVAMPSIGRDLGLPLAALHWVMTGFALGFGVALLAGARLVAAYGRRPLYLGALAVFAVASLVGAVADDGATLIATRVVKGVCAALTAPTGLAIIAASFPAGPARHRALSVYSFFGAAGFAVGLLLAGVLTEVSWRWTFGVAAPVALALLVAAVPLVPADRTAVRRRPDPIGAILLTVAASAALYGVVRLAGSGWRDPRAVGSLAVAVLSALLLALAQRRHTDPLLPAGLLRGSLARSALGAAALNGSYWGLLLVATLDLQLTRHWSPLSTALVLLPASALLVLAAPISGRLISRFGTARPILFGAVAALLGHLTYLVGAPTSAAPGYLTVAVSLVGVAFAVSFAALHVRAVSGLPQAAQPVAGALYQTAVQLGGAAALALGTAAVLAVGAPAGPVGGATVAGAQRPALLVVVALGLVGLLAAAFRPDADPTVHRGARPEPGVTVAR